MEPNTPGVNEPQILPTEPIQKEKLTKPKNNGFLLVLLSILLIIACIIAGFFAYQTQKLVKEFGNNQVELTTPTPVEVETPTPTTDPTSDWEVYKNTKPDFEIKYPNDYKEVEDSYGWPKAILLLYKGGQSYDLVIELWDSKSEYLSKYINEPAERLVVKQIGEKYVTLLNMNDDEEVTQIIETFRNITSTSPQP